MEADLSIYPHVIPRYLKKSILEHVRENGPGQLRSLATTPSITFALMAQRISRN